MSAPSTASASDTVPFHTFLWKVANRCNLDCDYCYVFNSVDDAWRRQPPFMALPTARAAAARMREHLAAHGREHANIVLHGGEPLLGGARRLAPLVAVVRETLDRNGILASVGMQSNLLLFDDAVGRFLVDHDVSIGVSVDGPPHANDRHRVDRRGRPTSARLEDRLRLLTGEYRSAFSGFLCVVDLDHDPVETVEYLASWAPPSIDFLLPLDNHDRRPPGKGGADGLEASPYGDWLTAAFDRWWAMDDPPPVRMFHSIIRMLCGSDTLVESLGLLPVDLIVIESDGSVEAVDSLRTTFAGATQLGFDVFDHTLDEVAAHTAVRARQLGARSLSPTCRRCRLVDVCGGGYLPHRWSAARGFDNPSVYCADLMAVIRHLDGAIRGELAALA